jgi:DNA invertase Pin-like site-specific DNA recombinase
VVIVWPLDRLTGQGVEETFRTIRRFRECGVRVVSVQEAWRGTGASGEFMMAIAARMAEQESARKSERIKAGLAQDSGRVADREIAGVKDRTPRKKSGYYARWERERAVGARAAS